MYNVSVVPIIAGIIAGWLGGCGGAGNSETVDAAAAVPDAAVLITCDELICGEDASCDDAGGIPLCTCNTGYQGDGTTCVDIDECVGDPCSPLAACTNTPGGFSCACEDGYSGDGLVCRALYTVSGSDALLRRIDPETAATLDSISITMAGATVDRGVALAAHPLSNQLYGVLVVDGDRFDRMLATIDPATGTALPIGATGLRIAGLAFDPSGTLYAITGDGTDMPAMPETLFTLNLATAAPTVLLPLGNGSDGEAIGYHPGDSRVYHASGHMGAEVIFESVDTAAGTVDNIDINGSPLQDEEAAALVYSVEGDGFLWKQSHDPGSLFLVTTGGMATLIGTVDHKAKGLAFLVY